MIYKKHGRFYAMEFWFRGKRYQKSTGVESRRTALEIERAFRTQLAKGEVGIEEKPKPERRKVSELLDALGASYEREGIATPEKNSLLRVVARAFGMRWADSLAKADVDSYIDRKKREGVAPKTINNHLMALATAYHKAKLQPPEIEWLKVRNTRQGFFTEEEFERLLAVLPEELLKDLCRFAMETGMRFGEIASLRWEFVQGGFLKLPGACTKNGFPRSVAIANEVKAILDRRRKAQAVPMNGHAQLSGLIFHHGGKRLGEFPRKAWQRACIVTGLGTRTCTKCGTSGPEFFCRGCKKQRKYVGRLFHDFRRVAVRSMVRAGVPQTVAMAISGHKTISVFQRYDIGSEADLLEASNRVAAYRRDRVSAGG
jgi:integrase